MPTVETSIRIAAARDNVVRVLLDADLAPRWTAGLDRLELIAGEPGEVGSIGHAHYQENGRHYVLVDKLEQAVPGQFYRSRITGGGIVATVETTLESVGAGATLLSVRWVGRGANPLTKVALVLMKRQIVRRTVADLASLKALAEEP